MKKIITMLLIVFASAVLANAFELNTMTTKDILHEQEKTELPTPVVIETERSSQEEAYTAAVELRKEFKHYNIQAKVTVVTPNGKKPYLLVTFASRQEYELSEDMFYQDPGPYPGYMGIGVSIRVPNRLDDSKSIPESAAKIIKWEFGLVNMGIKIANGEVERQKQMFKNKVAFEDALRLAMKSFIQDAEDPESPLALVMDREVCPEYNGSYENCIRDKLEEGQAVVKKLVNQKGSYIRVLKIGESAEYGETVTENWIFTLWIDNFTDHLHWAVVDRSGNKPVYNYGFN